MTELPKSGGARAGGGRKATPIDLRELEILSSLQSTDEEIASWFGVSVRTIQNRGKQTKFAEVTRRGKARGCVNVRRADEAARSWQPSHGHLAGEETAGTARQHADHRGQRRPHPDRETSWLDHMPSLLRVLHAEFSTFRDGPREIPDRQGTLGNEVTLPPPKG
jgi:hypothetical protein